MPRPAADPPTLTPPPMNTEAPPQPQETLGALDQQPAGRDALNIFRDYQPPTPAEKEEERRRWCIERAIDWLHYTPAGTMDGRKIADLAGDILAFIIGTPPQPQPSPDAQVAPAPTVAS